MIFINNELYRKNMRKKLHEGRLEDLIDQKELAAFEQSANAIIDDLIADGFEADDVRDYLIKRIYSSEEKHAGDIAGYEAERGSELSSDQASMYKEGRSKQKQQRQEGISKGKQVKNIYESAGVTRKGLINEAKRLQELAGIGGSIDRNDLENVEFDGIDHADYPDYADAYIISADHADGTPYSEDELDMLNNDSDLVYDLLMKYLN